MDKITQATSTRAETRLWRPSKTRLIAHENVSVSMYDSGALVASHARMDASSGRYVFTRLSDPGAENECPHVIVAALREAAEELWYDVHAESPHF